MEINHHGVDTSSNDQFLPGCWKMGIPNRMVTQHVTEGITDVSDMVVDIENDSIGGSIGRDPFLCGHWTCKTNLADISNAKVRDNGHVQSKHFPDISKFQHQRTAF
jgi:hypothetical protein